MADKKNQLKERDQCFIMNMFTSPNNFGFYITSDKFPKPMYYLMLD